MRMSVCLSRSTNYDAHTTTNNNHENNDNNIDNNDNNDSNNNDSGIRIDMHANNYHEIDNHTSGLDVGAVSAGLPQNGLSMCNPVSKLIRSSSVKPGFVICLLYYYYYYCCYYYRYTSSPGAFGVCPNNTLLCNLCICYVYIIVYICMYTHVYMYMHRERERCIDFVHCEHSTYHITYTTIIHTV